MTRTISRRSLLQVLASLPLLSVFRPKPHPVEAEDTVKFTLNGQDFGVWRVADDGVTLERVQESHDRWWS